jgi:hypothetical protein
MRRSLVKIGADFCFSARRRRQPDGREQHNCLRDTRSVLEGAHGR